ncbi:hypothetical protein BBJ28_00023128, partial [Nothophytophthora sp. Chile5]
MTRLLRLGADVSSSATASTAGPAAASVNLPSISTPSPLDEGDKKYSPMPPQRGGKPHSKKHQHVNEGRIQLEPLRPPTAGGGGSGRASARLVVSSSSGQVSWDSNVLEGSSTITENLSAFQALDRKLQFYRALSALKLREAAPSEHALQQTLSSLLVTAAAALDADALVLYAIADSAMPSLTVVACSKPGVVDFQVALETFAMRDIVAQAGVHDAEEAAEAVTTQPATSFVANLQNLASYDTVCDVDSLLRFSTASVLAGVLSDERGCRRFVVEARSSQEDVAFSKELFNATLATLENVVYAFKLRQALTRHAQTHAAMGEVLCQALGSPPVAVPEVEAEAAAVETDTSRTEVEDPKDETEWLSSPDVGRLLSQMRAVLPTASGVCLLELHAEEKSCKALSADGADFAEGRQEALCALVASDDSLFQRLLESAQNEERLDLSGEVALLSALCLETVHNCSLTFLPVPRSRSVRPSGVLCLSSGPPDSSTAWLFSPEPEIALEWELQPILAALALALAAKQRADDLRSSTRQKQQLLALCRSHFLVESVSDPSSLVALICEIGGAVFHTRHVTLYVSDMIKRELWSLSSLGSVNGLRIPYGCGIAGYVAATKETLTVHRPYEDPRFDRSFDAKFGFKTKSLLTVPVLNRVGETVGVLQAVNFGQFAAASPEVARFDAEVLAVYMRLVAHILRINSSLIIFAKVQADYWVKRAATLEDTREGDASESVANASIAVLGLGDAELGSEAKREVASVHSLLDLSGFDEAKRVPRNKWSTFAYACWALGRFLAMQRLARVRLQHLRQMRRENATDGNDSDHSDLLGEEAPQEADTLAPRLRTRSRTASVVRASRAHSLINRWHRMTMTQGGVGHLEELLADSFDPLAKSIPELENHAYQLFEELVLIDTFRIEQRTLRAFIGELASRYRDVPYHSFYHGFDVALASFALLRSPEVLAVVKELEALSLLVAALGHDADHPGNDNQFEVDSNSPLALCYNDISVLENHHAATTFAVLQRES